MTACRFTETVTIVTGASRGIGFAIAHQIVAEGGRVVLTGRNQVTLAEAASKLGPNATVMAGGADDTGHQDATIAYALDTFGRLDHLVNNAGINPLLGPIVDSDIHAVRKILDVNLLATFEWTRKAVAAGLTSSVVNLSSASSFGASAGIGFYAVSKAALNSLTTQLASELAPSIRVNAVAPAIIKTRMASALYEGREAEAAALYPLTRLGETRDVALPVAFLLSNDSAWITGQTIAIDGGIGSEAVG